MTDERPGSNFGESAHAMLRVFSALILMQHGFQKLFGMFGSERVTNFVSLQGVAAFLETFGALLLLVGLFTRPVAFLLSGEMAVAYFLFHAQRGPIPVVNRGEVSSLLCFIFFYFLATGGGRYSVDAILRRGRGAVLDSARAT